MVTAVGVDDAEAQVQPVVVAIRTSMGLTAVLAAVPLPVYAIASVVILTFDGENRKIRWEHLMCMDSREACTPSFRWFRSYRPRCTRRLRSLAEAKVEASAEQAAVVDTLE
jgi:hypothetical protein